MRWVEGDPPHHYVKEGIVTGADPLSTLEKIATQAGTITVGVTAFALGDASGGTLTATALSALAALGLSQWSGSLKQACEAAIKQAVADAQTSGEFSDDELSRAESLLVGVSSSVVTLQPEEIAEAVRQGDFVAVVTKTLVAAVWHRDQGAGVKRILEISFEAGLRACEHHHTFRSGVTWELNKFVAQKQAEQDSKLNKILERMNGFSGAMADPDALSLDDLQALAARFGATDMMTKGALVGFLQKKAEEYQSYRAQIDRIDDRVAGLDNLKTAAKDAAERLDFDEVEELLSRVDEVETEIAAETKELRAQNALLRGRVEDAFKHLSAAADSFAGIDPLEPYRRRLDYDDYLYRYGLSYGGQGLALAARMCRTVLEQVSESQQPDLWARAQNKLGIILQNQGDRSSESESAELLNDSIAAFHAALRVFTETGYPVEWAKTQNNLGIALQIQGVRAPEDDGSALLQRAVSAYRAALRVYTEKKYPEQWATTTSNLAITLKVQGLRSTGKKSSKLIASAISTFRAALRVRSELGKDVDWAMTQINLGNALAEQGARTKGKQGNDLLADAISAYNSAHEVYTKGDHPIQFAVTHENLALAEQARAKHETCREPKVHIEAALAYVEAALSIYDPDDTPLMFQETSGLKESLQRKLSEL